MMKAKRDDDSRGDEPPVADRAEGAPPHEVAHGQQVRRAVSPAVLAIGAAIGFVIALIRPRSWR